MNSGNCWLIVEKSLILQAGNISIENTWIIIHTEIHEIHSAVRLVLFLHRLAALSA